jgi:2-isopropylmalate synthase
MSKGKKTSPVVEEDGGRQSWAPAEGEARKATPPGRARILRHNMTDAEQALWRILRNQQFAHTKFRRQVPIGPYIADFACYDARLVVEAEGGQHPESTGDAERDARFAAEGFRTIRFWNSDILKSPESVAIAIGVALTEK